METVGRGGVKQEQSRGGGLGLGLGPGSSRRRKTSGRATVDVTPSASRLTNSLRDIGYDGPTAIADLVDNSIDAGASRVDIRFEFGGAGSSISIVDNGSGMTRPQLDEALRFGSRRRYASGDLGRFGLGLKTASLSLGRCLDVCTRPGERFRMRRLDLDRITENDRWEVAHHPADEHMRRLLDRLGGRGTAVRISTLDRVLTAGREESGWARRRLSGLATRTREHLAMVFHRFLEARGAGRVRIRVNGKAVEPWNPFAISEEHTRSLGEKSFEVEAEEKVYGVQLSMVVLPPRSLFSSQEAFERMSGPQKWNRQQGLYIYRANRLIQSGGWCGLRALDEHTKLARAALDFPMELDALFNVNVAKMRVGLPAQLRKSIEPALHELCHRANSVYRTESRTSPGEPHPGSIAPDTSPRGSDVARRLGLSLSLAAREAGEAQALERIMERLRDVEPELAGELGWAGD